jgi:uncharacterized cupredoxin-like copper-binding protein
MRSRLTVLPLALAAACVVAASALARPAATYQVNVTMRDSSCTLARTSVSKNNTKIVFHLINDGKAAHGFKVGGKTSAMVKPAQSADLVVNFGKTGKFPYTCTGGAGKGVFTIRTT